MIGLGGGLLDSAVMTIIQALLRAFHVIFAIMWIGFLFYFTLVQREAMRALGAAAPAVLRATVPRAMSLFSMAAVWTFLTGVLLLGMVYHMGGLLYDDGGGSGVVTFLVFFTALLMVGAFDQLVERFSGLVATIGGLLMLMTLIILMNRVANFGARSLFIHIGGVLGLVLIMNVTMRVAPVWRKNLLPAIEAGEDLDPVTLDKVASRANQSVFIAIPTVLLMISNHYPTLYGSEQREAVLMGVIVFGFVIAWFLLRRRPSETTE